MWRCLRALIVAIIVLAVAAIATLLVAPEKIRDLAKWVGGTAAFVAQRLPATLPPVTKIDKAYWLPQNWTARDRFWFHHTSQGTATFPIPYVWFLALERPEFSFTFSRVLLRDDAYLRRFGFIPSPDAKTLKADATTFGYHGDQPASAIDVSVRDNVTGYPDNPDGLPVGFAKLKGGNNPTTGKDDFDQLGFTCAACHTGHIEYKNVSLRFDGGPAMVNLGEVERAIALSIAYTLIIPFRFDRFADVVSEIGGSPVDKTKLKEQLQFALDKIVSQKKLENEILLRARYDHAEEGFGRLDALNRIGNQVFFANMLPHQGSAGVLPKARLEENFARHDAPVSFPPIWGTPWFSWAQYDASVFNELVRNAGEALGVKAELNMTVDSKEHPLFRSSVKIQNIYWFEKMLAGPDPFKADKPGDTPQFKGLVAPKWRDAAAKFSGDAAWDVDKAKVAQGREYYREHCFECHRGPVNDPEFKDKWPDDSFWETENSDQRGEKAKKNWITVGDRRYFNVVQKPVTDIGTDRQQSRVLTERRVNLPDLHGTSPIDYLNTQRGCEFPKERSLNAPFVLALMAVVDRTIEQWFDDEKTPKELKDQMWGPRKNCQNRQVFTNVRPIDDEKTTPNMAVVPHYRARPLDGVWATAPYLHNGSVPTLYDMLLPQDQRPTTFCVGSREFDPGKVGLKMAPGKSCGAGLFRLNTSELGNSNLGHSFQGTETDKRKLPPGIIGRELTPNERSALVEYLKTL